MGNQNFWIYKNIAEEILFDNSTNSPVFSGDGKYFLIPAIDNKTIIIYDALTLKCIKKIEWIVPKDENSYNYYGYYGTTFCLSYDGAYVYAKDYSKIHLFNLDGTLFKTISINSNEVLPYSPNEFVLLTSNEYGKYYIKTINFINDTEKDCFNLDTYGYLSRLIENSDYMYYHDYSNYFLVNFITKESVKLEVTSGSINSIYWIGNKIIMSFSNWPNNILLCYEGLKQKWTKTIQNTIYINELWVLEDDNDSIYILQNNEDVVIIKMNENSDSNHCTIRINGNYYFKYPYLISLRVKRELWYQDITSNTVNIIYLNVDVSATENTKFSENQGSDEDTSIMLALDYIDHFKVGEFNFNRNRFEFYQKQFMKNTFSDSKILWFYKVRLNNLKK